MVLSIRNDRDEEIDRKIVGVGAMRPGEAAHVHADGRSVRRYEERRAQALTSNSRFPAVPPLPLRGSGLR